MFFSFILKTFKHFRNLFCNLCAKPIYALDFFKLIYKKKKTKNKRTEDETNFEQNSTSVDQTTSKWMSNLGILILLSANAYKLVILCDSCVHDTWCISLVLSMHWLEVYNRELETDLNLMANGKTQHHRMYIPLLRRITYIHLLNTNQRIVPTTEVALNFLFNRI